MCACVVGFTITQTQSQLLKTNTIHRAISSGLQDQDDDQQAMGWNSKDRLQWFQRPLCFAATDSVAFSTDLRTALFVYVYEGRSRLTENCDIGI